MNSNYALNRHLKFHERIIHLNAMKIVDISNQSMPDPKTTQKLGEKSAKNIA